MSAHYSPRRLNLYAAVLAAAVFAEAVAVRSHPPSQIEQSALFHFDHSAAASIAQLVYTWIAPLGATALLCLAMNALIASRPVTGQWTPIICLLEIIVAAIALLPTVLLVMLVVLNLISVLVAVVFLTMLVGFGVWIAGVMGR